LAAEAEGVEQRHDLLGKAAATYALAYRRTGGFWTGINAATTHLLTGELAVAEELARKVRGECLGLLERESPDRYWVLAALGEAALVLRR